MAMLLPTFDELYVVSDIHMGGSKDSEGDFQIFNRGERLGAFARHIAELRPNDEVALVLNGDVIDSLAEDEVERYVALDADEALRMMRRLYSDPSFKPVWEGLAALVAKPKRHLVFVVGNHDIELALPVVEYSIRQQLAGGDAAAASRIHFATHGGGFGCQVGGARVFCTHGNELDPWNPVDHDGLAQLANAMNAGRRVPATKWKPNGGTRLVVDVMNTVKRRHPFVDLLKPEVAAVASVLLALDRETLAKIDFGDAFPLLRDKVRGRLVTRKLLGAEEMTLKVAPTEAVAEAYALELLGPSFREAIEEERRAGGGASEDDLLLRASRPASEPLEEVAPGAGPETLGVKDLFAGWIGAVPRPEALRRALKDWLEGDRHLRRLRPRRQALQADARARRGLGGLRRHGPHPQGSRHALRRRRLLLQLRHVDPHAAAH